MKYDQEIEREIVLEEQDFIDLFRRQEVNDDGTVLRISKLDFLRALGRLDPMAQLTDEEAEELREEHGTPHHGEIDSVVMENDYTPEERDDEFDDLLLHLSSVGTEKREVLVDSHGQWVVERLFDHEDVEYDRERALFEWTSDTLYDPRDYE